MGYKSLSTAPCNMGATRRFSVRSRCDHCAIVLTDSNCRRLGGSTMKTKHTVAIALLAGVAIGAIAVQGLHAQAKPPAYVVTEIDVVNVEEYVREYAPLAQASIKAAGGRLLAVGLNVVALEGAQ